MLTDSVFQAHRGELHILVAVVNYKTKLQKARLGLCSNWLASLKPGDAANLWIQKGSLQFPSKVVSANFLCGKP